MYLSNEIFCGFRRYGTLLFSIRVKIFVQEKCKNGARKMQESTGFPVLFVSPFCHQSVTEVSQNLTLIDQNSNFGSPSHPKTSSFSRVTQEVIAFSFSPVLVIRTDAVNVAWWCFLFSSRERSFDLSPHKGWK